MLDKAVVSNFDWFFFFFFLQNQFLYVNTVLMSEVACHDFMDLVDYFSDPYDELFWIYEISMELAVLIEMK